MRAAAWHDAVSSTAAGLAYNRVWEHRWQPTMTVEGILQLVMYNMIFCESVFVTTATGPGGMAGPLRIDLSKGRMVRPRVCNRACAVKRVRLAKALWCRSTLRRRRARHSSARRPATGLVRCMPHSARDAGA